jgi:uroporphyrinogen decarboxylase
LDPCRLLGEWAPLQAAADRVLDQAGTTGHIFNLGHGILPQTNPDQVKRLVDHVHAASAARRSRA